ncbi:unnamed protein product [Bemisia tabaci]|uniref:Uncharacterized protein n=1 Tax=Bemisia tabaci TaxID=7038 RepID=A0A9P0F298_BEMTA|nr:unnamed protein product [Bemisia tabaci]
MGKIKNSVRKTCPECAYQQVAVACKFCPKCKYSFVAKKDTYVPPPSATDPKKEENSKEPNPDNRRRTERVKRVKPNFYDASEFERKPKKVQINWNGLYSFLTTVICLSPCQQNCSFSNYLMSEPPL